MLEYMQNPFSYFITLTYSDEHLPEGGNLEPRDLQLYWKRLRKNTGKSLRYFAVGEYGDRTRRPHYHAVVFTQNEITEQDFKDSWLSDSIVDVAPIYGRDDARKIARYCAGYVLKKLTTEKAMAHANLNLHPEFTRSSRRPGIGLGNIDFIADSLIRRVNSGHITLDTDSFLHMLRFDGKLWPIGTVLRGKLLAKLGGPTSTEVHKALMTHIRTIQREGDPVLQDVENKKRIDSERKALKINKARKNYGKI